MTADFARILPDVAKRLCADRPLIERGDDLRIGTHGSLVVHVAGARAGTWTNFEDGASGGCLGLVEHVLQVDRAGALRWLVAERLIEPTRNGAHSGPRTAPRQRPQAAGSAGSRPAGPVPPQTSPHNGPRIAPRRQPGTWIPPEPPPTAGVALAAIEASIEADATPARDYLADVRWCWPRALPLPASVRWIDRADFERLPTWTDRRDRVKRYRLPPDAAGAMLMLMSEPGAPPDAVSMTALTDYGARRLWYDARKVVNAGPQAGRVFDAAQEPGGKLFIVEGPLDALALVAIGCRGVVRAVVGTLALYAVTDPERRPVVLVGDADAPGAKATAKVQGDLLDVDPGRPCAVLYRRQGDPGDWLKARIIEAAAERIGDRYGDGIHARESVAAAWQDLIEHPTRFNILEEL